MASIVNEMPLDHITDRLNTPKDMWGKFPNIRGWLRLPSCSPNENRSCAL